MKLYLIFHLNLMYSSIEEEQRKEVIEKCYLPILEIAEEHVPIGIELPGITLEIIEKLNQGFIDRFKKLIKQKRAELIGSGYSQIIGPLWPRILNTENQIIGREIYRDILGIEPQIALINEMAYSCGIVDIYRESGYKAIVMEWNNPYRFHREWDKELKYFPCLAKSIKHNLPVIWADSIAFQKFQRYAHGEISLREYMDYIENQTRPYGFFPLYANDAEIFNFRPGRYRTENTIEHDEWKRIKKLLCVLKKNGFKFTLPSETLINTKNVELRLESPQQPIPVKKQEKYNINRWALTGRDNLRINTALYNIVKRMKTENFSKEEKKTLLFLASSDFRTHITQRRWSKFKNKLEELSILFKNNKNVTSSSETNLNPRVKQSKFHIFVETDGLILVFSKIKGLTAKEVLFKKHKKPTLGTLPHGYYDDISLGVDFFSFHSIVEMPGEHKFTNLQRPNFNLSITNSSVILEDIQSDRKIKFHKRYEIKKQSINIYIKIEMPRRELSLIHPLNITFLPEAFSKNTLFFATNNGGDLEIFHLNETEVKHSESLSTLISAKYGLGATEGVVIVGDNNTQIRITHDQTKSALIPSVHYKPLDNSFFLRLQYSAQEMDETFVENENPYEVECYFTIEANK